jgi:hypothetical protein
MAPKPPAFGTPRRSRGVPLSLAASWGPVAPSLFVPRPAYRSSKSTVAVERGATVISLVTVRGSS